MKKIKFKALIFTFVFTSALVIGQENTKTNSFLSLRNKIKIQEPTYTEGIRASGSLSFKTDSLQSLSQQNIRPLKWYDMFTNIPGDYTDFYHQAFTRENIPLILGIAVSTAGLVATDNITYKYQHEKIYASNDFSRFSSDLFTELGDGRTQFSLAAGFAAYGFIAKDNRALRTASQIVEAVLAAGTVVQVLKHSTGRESPVVSTSPSGVWRLFPSIFDYHRKIPAFDAYPSGHVATSLAAFTVIAENYPEYKWIRPVSYTVVAMIGFAMVDRGEHWYSDYPLAVALGYSFGKLISDSKVRADRAGGNKVSYSLFPYMSSVGSGISLGVTF